MPQILLECLLTSHEEYKPLSQNSCHRKMLANPSSSLILALGTESHQIHRCHQDALSCTCRVNDSRMSDWHPKSPQNIIVESKIRVLRIKEMTTILKGSCLNANYSCSSHREYFKYIMGIHILMSRCKGLKI